MSDKAWTVGYIIDWRWHTVTFFFSPCRWNHIQVVQRHHPDGKNSLSECQRAAEDIHQNNGHDLSNVEPLVEAHISRTDGDSHHRPHTEHLWHTLPGKSRLTGDNELQFDLQNVFKHCQHSVLNQYNSPETYMISHIPVWALMFALIRCVGIFPQVQNHALGFWYVELEIRIFTPPDNVLIGLWLVCTRKPEKFWNIGSDERMCMSYRLKQKRFLLCVILNSKHISFHYNDWFVHVDNTGLLFPVIKSKIINNT